MSIRTNIEAVADQIAGGNTALGDEIREQAVMAIMGGQGSAEWQTYMERFSQSPAQLARLLPTDSTAGVFEFDLARTYLVGNGPCGAVTTGNLLNGVGDTLDQNP